MVIYGTKAHPLKSQLLEHEVCSNCNTKGKMVMTIFSKYVHIFWIPTFPIGRVGVCTCMNCQQTLLNKEMPMFLKMQYEQLVPSTRVPLWTWSGLVVIVAFIGYAVFMSGVDKENDKKYISEPEAGDLYSFKTQEGYSMMKVAEVKSDSLLIQFSEYETDTQSSVYKLKEKDFDSIGIWVSRETISTMYDSSKIFKVTR